MYITHMPLPLIAGDSSEHPLIHLCIRRLSHQDNGGRPVSSGHHSRYAWRHRPRQGRQTVPKENI